MSSRRRRHRHALSPAAKTPLDDDDLLSEILLRLPPLPSSLPRASLVCQRWRRLVSDPRFCRRFRLHHRRNPPLLGYFDRFFSMSFRPTLEDPNRLPPERFSLPLDDDFGHPDTLGCRHGLLLIRSRKLCQVLVWDPVTGDQHRIAVPVQFDKKNFNGAVLRAPGDDQHFQVVLVAVDVDEKQHERALACVYSSKAVSWGNLVSTRLPYQAPVGPLSTVVFGDTAVLAGGSLYWRLYGNFNGILEFDLERQSLPVIRVPLDMYGKDSSFKIMPAEGGGLGFLFVSSSDYTAQLWKRMTDYNDVASWGLARTIELDKLLQLKPKEKAGLHILGFAEENNVMFLWTRIGHFLIHLESLKFKNLFGSIYLSRYYPFESVYTAGARVGGEHDGAELLPST